MYAILSQSKPSIIIYHKKFKIFSKLTSKCISSIKTYSEKERIPSLTNLSHQSELSGCHNHPFQ